MFDRDLRVHKTHPDLSYFKLSYVFGEHNDSIGQGTTVLKIEKICTDLKLPVRKAEFPQASIILIINEKARNVLAFSSRSKNPNKIEVTPTVPIPKFSVNFIPMRFIFAPEIKV